MSIINISRADPIIPILVLSEAACHLDIGLPAACRVPCRRMFLVPEPAENESEEIKDCELFHQHYTGRTAGVWNPGFFTNKRTRGEDGHRHQQGEAPLFQFLSELRCQPSGQVPCEWDIRHDLDLANTHHGHRLRSRSPIF